MVLLAFECGIMVSTLMPVNAMPLTDLARSPTWHKHTRGTDM